MRTSRSNVPSYACPTPVGRPAVISVNIERIASSYAASLFPGIGRCSTILAVRLSATASRFACGVLALRNIGTNHDTFDPRPNRAMILGGEESASDAGMLWPNAGVAAKLRHTIVTLRFLTSREKSVPDANRLKVPQRGRRVIPSHRILARREGIELLAGVRRRLTGGEKAVFHHATAQPSVRRSREICRVNPSIRSRFPWSEARCAIDQQIHGALTQACARARAVRPRPWPCAKLWKRLIGQNYRPEMGTLWPPVVGQDHAR